MSRKIERPAAVAGASAEVAAPVQPAVYTIHQAAKALQVSDKTIYNALNAGKLFSVYILGARRIPADEIRRLAALGTVMSADEIDAHYHRVNPENAAWAREEMVRRLAVRAMDTLKTAHVMLPDDWTEEEQR
jgi:excisionase family DNA binding protein